MEQDVLVKEHGSILEVVFNRPTKYNAMNRAISRGLLNAIQTLRDRKAGFFIPTQLFKSRVLDV